MTPTRLPGFRGEFLWELEIATRQTVAIAETIPRAKYDWRPSPQARSVSEVFVHIGTGNFNWSLQRKYGQSSARDKQAV